MPFPSNPTNGQVANVNGISYTYNSSIPAWTVTTNTGGNVTGNNITATNNVSGGALNSTGTISAQGNITGNYILGNGALLTGVITSVANINSGNSNVTVVSAGGNVTVGVGGTNNVAVFATTGEFVTGVVSATGNISGNFFIGNGSQLTGISTGNSSITITQTTISANYTITTGQNGLSVGPMTTANGVQVSVANGQRWIIL